MGFAKFLLCGLSVIGIMCVSSTAQAGFEFGKDDDSHSKSIAGGSATKQETQIYYKVSPPVDSSDPALQIYNDRYVPDSVKKKYGLRDEWFAKPQTILPPETINEVVPVDTIAVVPTPQKPESVTQSWRARKGENVRDILRRWSEREKTELMWASEDVPVLLNDFSYVGKFQGAVNQLVFDASGGRLHLQFRSEGLDPVMMVPASTVTTDGHAPDIAPLPLEMEPVPIQMKDVVDNNDLPLPQIDTPQPQAVKAFKPADKDRLSETRWLGLSGAPLAEVLRVWAEQAHVKVIWQSERNYALLESVTRIGTFEEAVFDALSQYDNEDVRPVGEIYNDLQTGERVLLVRTAVDN